MVEQKSWFSRGTGRLKEKKAKQRARSMAKGLSNRFFLRQPETRRDGDTVIDGREVIFIEDIPFEYDEHEIWVGKKPLYFPCNLGISDDDPTCAACDSDDDYYTVGLYTILDCTEWRDRDGNIRRYTRRIFPAKTQTMDKLETRKETRGSIVGCRFYISRTGKMTPKVGDDFDMLREEELMEHEDGAEVRCKRDDGSLYTKKMVLADQKFWWKNKEGVLQPPVPFDFESIVQLVSNDEMKRLISGAGKDVFDDERERRRQERSDDVSYA